jgi:Na+/proline symporter
VLAYTGLLFAIAYLADRRRLSDPSARRNIIVYGLSIAVYCTSWTFYGAVGTAEARGWEYLPIYLGPAIIFSAGYPLLSRMVEIGKRIHTTSIADFLSAHYQKSQALAALVASIAVVGAIPYIALQLKSVATTYEYIAPQSTTSDDAGGVFFVAVILAAFAIIFGTRHIDITRHNRGMIAAIAFDSVIKLVALLAVSIYAFLLMQSGGETLSLDAASPFKTPISIDRFITLTVLSMAAILCLPRQFHVTVVECQDAKALRPASALFLIYLLLISFLVVPIASAGRAATSLADVSPDLMVLALPLAAGADWLALLVFVGGFAAATGMVIVASVALSTMITNDLVAPFLLRDAPRRTLSSSFGLRLLYVRRVSIAAITLASAVFAAYAPQGQQLASFGILSFAAAAQFLPALIGALYWKRAHLFGAVAGMGAGFTLWLLCLIFPSYFGATANAVSALTSWLDFTGWDALTRGVAVSLGADLGLKKWSGMRARIWFNS